MEEKSIKTNVILNIVRTVLSIIYPLITFPYVSRVLSADGIGKVQFAASIVSYFALIASLGISTYAIREGSRLRDKKEKLNKFCNQVFSFNIITTMITYIAITILIFSLKQDVEYKYLIIIQSMTIIFTTLGVDWINAIFEDYKYITIRSVILQFITLIFTFVFIHNSNDYYVYALITVISSVGANILNFFYIKRYCKIKFTLSIDIKKHFRPIIILFSNSIAATVYKDADITMLGILCDDFTVGIYYIGSKIYYIIKQILNSIITVIIPRVSNYNANNEKQKKEKLLNNVINILIVLILPAVVGLISLKNEIIWIISGEVYKDAANSLAILAIALIFAVLANFSSNLILILEKQEKKSLMATTIAAISNIGLNFIFIPLWKSIGAAITTLIAEAIVAIITTVYAIKYFKPKIQIKILLSSIIGCGIIIIITRCMRYCNYNIIWYIICSIMYSSVAYILIMLVTNMKEIKEVLKKRDNI